MIMHATGKKESKKLFLIFHGRFPSNKAASLFAAKSCEAFADEGLDVTLLVSRRLGREKGDPYAYYAVRKNFRIAYVPVLDLPSKDKLTAIRFAFSSFTFALACYAYLVRHATKDDVIYSNEWLPILAASASFPKTFYEMHDFPERGLGLFGIFMRRMSWLLIHNTWKAEMAKKTFRLDAARVLREPNAVQPDEFDIPLTKEEARMQLALPQDKKIVVYTGHLYGWKGVDTLAEASRMLPEEYLVVFVGGTPEDRQKLASAYEGVATVRFVGHVPHAEIPVWQKAADVLVLPNTAKENISKYYTSPMKLFEYLASRAPVVASRIPSIEEIVSEQDVFFAEPDSAASFAETIQKAVQNPHEAVERATRAYGRVLEFTWDKRAKRILAFMDRTPPFTVAENRAVWHLLFRYLCSGGLAFVSNLGLFVFFEQVFDLWYVAASTLAFIISVGVSFLAQKFITFRDHSRDRTFRQFGWYIVIALFNVSMNALMMYAFVDGLHLSHLFAQVLSAGLIAVWSLGVYRYIIFPNASVPETA
jgi:glycosyltransferase involved in cell wall biosynthesis/putative flippase GtrA